MQFTLHYVSPEETLSVIQSNQRVFVHGSACTPTAMLRTLAKRKNELENVELVFITVLGDFFLDAPEFAGHFAVNSMFVSGSVREAINSGRGDFIPVFLSEIPLLFRHNILPLDVAIVQVSPPDANGYCSLGPSVDVARAAVQTAKHVIAQVNPQVPRTHGDSFMHVSNFDSMAYVDEPLHEVFFGQEIGDVEERIGANVAELIDDRATLQMGIGSIPDAVLAKLTNHKDLGIHTEMFSDGIIDLCEKGIINNKFKHTHPYKSVAGFAAGSRRLYDYIHDNPAFAFLDIQYVNDPAVIKRNPGVHAINSAIEIDLTGQVCADSIGTYQFSGIGGQMDFMRGAALSEGGKPILALPSRTKKGIPRIVPVLNPGAGVVTTRGHVHYVVTEYGAAYLFGKNLRQRAKALIEIAHPDDREALTKAAAERFKIFV